MNAVKSRRTLVTGASRGIGLEFVRQLLQRGDFVLATARHPERAKELGSLAQVHPERLQLLTLDVTDTESFSAVQAAVAERVPALDLLINNAGVLPGGERFGQLQAQNLLEAFRTNAMGPLLLTQALRPLLQQGHHPLVLNLSSILGSIAQTESFYTPSYAISKAALNMAGVLLGQVMAKSGVRVVNLHPGWVRTDMGGDGASLEKDAAVKAILATIEELPADANGIFVDRFGDELPW
jgi:NAD(P)-dependent dehydrogenase (short-subunit alcohol dehydrogenase family)